MPAGEWITRDAAVDLLGLPERQFDRLVAARLVDVTGRGAGRRYRAADVRACAQLFERLRPLLPPARPVQDADADED